MAVLTPTAKMQFFTADGEPLVGGKLYTYSAGTTTPQVTYTDNTAVTANTNPIILDSRGEANIWLGGLVYKFKLTDADDVEIWTVDYISAPTSSVSPVFSGNATIDTNSPNPALKITQLGAGYALRVQSPSDPSLSAFVVNSDGKIGVNTDTLTEYVNIAGGNILCTSAAGTAYFKITPGASATEINAVGARALSFATNSVERMQITSAGVVKANTISELTPGSGVTAGGVLLDAGVVAASARPLTAATAQTPSGVNAVAFHNLPSYVRRITIMLNAVTVSTNNRYLDVQLGTGTSGSPVWISSGYNSLWNSPTDSGYNYDTAGFIILDAYTAYSISGAITLTRSTASTWESTSSVRGDTAYMYVGCGGLTGAGTITQLRLFWSAGATFTGGTINILYE